MASTGAGDGKAVCLGSGVEPPARVTTPLVLVNVSVTVDTTLDGGD